MSRERVYVAAGFVAVFVLPLLVAFLETLL